MHKQRCDPYSSRPSYLSDGVVGGSAFFVPDMVGLDNSYSVRLHDAAVYAALAPHT